MNERLKQLRKALGLSQEELGKRVGVTGPGISKLESGDRNITEQMLKSICREFGASEEWLRTGVGEMLTQTNENAAASLSEKYNLGLYGEQLLATYLGLSDAYKRSVERFVVQLTANVQKAEDATSGGMDILDDTKRGIAE